MDSILLEDNPHWIKDVNSVYCVLWKVRVLKLKLSSFNFREFLRYKNIEYNSPLAIAQNRIEIFYLWRPNLDDKDDDFLIELAIASNSKIIIIDNKKDLESGELNFDLEVLTPQIFLERYKRWVH